MTLAAGLGVTRLPARSTKVPAAPEAQTQGTTSPPEPPGGTSPADTLIQTSGLQIWEGISLRCFQPPSLWHFATVALRNL